MTGHPKVPGFLAAAIELQTCAGATIAIHHHAAKHPEVNPLPQHTVPYHLKVVKVRRRWSPKSRQANCDSERDSSRARCAWQVKHQASKTSPGLQAHPRLGSMVNVYAGGQTAHPLFSSVNLHRRRAGVWGVVVRGKVRAESRLSLRVTRWSRVDLASQNSHATDIIVRAVVGVCWNAVHRCRALPHLKGLRGVIVPCQHDNLAIFVRFVCSQVHCHPGGHISRADFALPRYVLVVFERKVLTVVLVRLSTSGR